MHFVDVQVLLVATPEMLILAQGDGYTGLADTYLDKWLPTQSNGGLSKLWVRYEDVMHGLLRFDLCGPAATATPA